MSLLIGLSWLGCYLFGAIPFAYILARFHGVNLFQIGSGNIGATNVGRAIGRKWGILVFVLDFLKGVLPTLALEPILRIGNPDLTEPFGITDILKVGAGGFALLGHIFPIYLGFKGGKGVATGAGVALVLMPIPAIAAVLTWLVTLAWSRYVSLASILAAVVLMGSRLLLADDPFSPDAWLISTFCLLGGGFVIVKHRSNMTRLYAGTETRIGASPQPTSSTSATS